MKYPIVQRNKIIAQHPVPFSIQIYTGCCDRMTIRPEAGVVLRRVIMRARKSTIALARNWAACVVVESYAANNKSFVCMRLYEGAGDEKKSMI